MLGRIDNINMDGPESIADIDRLVRAMREWKPLSCELFGNDGARRLLVKSFRFQPPFAFGYAEYISTLEKMIGKTQYTPPQILNHGGTCWWREVRRLFGFQNQRILVCQKWGPAVPGGVLWSVKFVLPYECLDGETLYMIMPWPKR